MQWHATAGGGGQPGASAVDPPEPCGLPPELAAAVLVEVLRPFTGRSADMWFAIWEGSG